MTPTEFRSARILIGLNQTELGRAHLGKSLRAVKRYESGEVPIPHLVAEKMRSLVGLAG